MANVGIDISIERLRSKFENSLYTGNDCNYYGRIFRHQYDDGIVPQRWITPKDAEDVLLNDKVDLTSFFDVQPTDSYDGVFVSNVWICFSVNLSNLHPTLTRNEATETVHKNVLKEIKKIGGWKVNNLVRGITAFSDYARVKDSDDRHPYYLFRFDCEVKYPINC